jgi:hypothetical protein
MRLQRGDWPGRRGWAPLLVVLVATASGCGRPQSGTLSGNVRYRGTTVTSGMVTFHGPDGQSAVTYVQPNGTYQATNVSLGEVRITVREPPASPGGVKSKMKQVNRDSPPTAEAKGVELPKAYADPQKTMLTVTVTGGSQPFDIEMN